tara:strand:- start:8778 stop:9770 length:993 start_codon:yes stop_codon:yes gene_type:complete
VIITKTPFRISFFGGGTDYPKYFKEHGGSVLSASIDKYAYITCRQLPPFFKHKHRVVYSKIEEVDSIEEINHPAVKAVLNEMNISDGIEIHYDGDLPARSGVGSSSSFTVGLLNALENYKNNEINKFDLAKKAINIEQNIIKETVGSQDQIAAAYGNLNKISFHRDETFKVEQIPISIEKKTLLEDHLILFFTGVSRIASETAIDKVNNIHKSKDELNLMLKHVDKSIDILKSNTIPIVEFGRLLNETWQLKKRLSKKISNSFIDSFYKKAIDAGAEGGKLLGAGNGGFLMFFVKPQNRKYLINAMKPLTYVPIKFDTMGSRIIFNGTQI